MLAGLGGGLALVALAAFPGLVVVRAPWWAVPFLSAAFWIVSWWWVPLGRAHCVLSALAAVAVLAGLRLFKPLGMRRPSWPSLLAAAGMLAGLGPVLVLSQPPASELGVPARDAALLAWHDGIPTSGEPLLPGQRFRPPSFGLSALAADVALQSATPLPRAAFLAAAFGHGLLSLGLFGFLSRLLSPAWASLLALLAPSLLGWRDPALPLAVALVLA